MNKCAQNGRDVLAKGSFQMLGSLALMLGAVSCTYNSPREATHPDNLQRKAVPSAKSERADWNEAVLAGTIEALDGYLERHAQGEHAEITRDFRRALEADLTRRRQDNLACGLLGEDALAKGGGIPKETLGADYALWRSLTGTDRARVLFEAVSAGTRNDAVGRALTEERYWPPKEWPPHAFDPTSVSTSVEKYLPFESPDEPGRSSARARQKVYGWKFYPQVVVDTQDDRWCLARILQGQGILVVIDPWKLDTTQGRTVSLGLAPTGEGSVHMFAGAVELFGLRFHATGDAPLRFAITKNGDYAHIGGRGFVRALDGVLVFSK